MGQEESPRGPGDASEARPPTLSEERKRRRGRGVSISDAGSGGSGAVWEVLDRELAGALRASEGVGNALAAGLERVEADIRAARASLERKARKVAGGSSPLTSPGGVPHGHGAAAGEEEEEATCEEAFERAAGSVGASGVEEAVGRGYRKVHAHLTRFSAAAEEVFGAPGAGAPAAALVRRLRGGQDEGRGFRRGLDLAVAHHLRHVGMWETGAAWMRHAGLSEEDVSAESLAGTLAKVAQLRVLLADVGRGSVEQAMAWAEGRRERLEAVGSHLMFHLVAYRYMRVLLEGGQRAALEFARAEFPKLGPRHGAAVAMLMCQLSFARGAAVPHTHEAFWGWVEAEAERAARAGGAGLSAQALHADVEFLARVFGRGGGVGGARSPPPPAAVLQSMLAREFCRAEELSCDSPLYLVALAGAMSFPTLAKVGHILERRLFAEDSGAPARPATPALMGGRTLRQILRQSHSGGDLVRWKDEVRVQLPVELDLGPRFLFYSIFACPVNRDQCTADNPPKLLPCGHVVSDKAIDRICKGNEKRIKCPYCPLETTAYQCRHIYA